MHVLRHLFNRMLGQPHHCLQACAEVGAAAVPPPRRCGTLGRRDHLGQITITRPPLAPHGNCCTGHPGRIGPLRLARVTDIGALRYPAYLPQPTVV